MHFAFFSERLYVSSRHRKASRWKKQNASAACSCLTDKDHPEATSCKPLMYHGKPVICNSCSHSAKPAWRLQKKMIWQALQKRCSKRRRSRNGIFCDCRLFNSSKQYANTCMAVLIRRATCESLISFWGQRKVLSCKICLRGLRPGFFHGGSERLSFFKLRPSRRQQPF